MTYKASGNAEVGNPAFFDWKGGIGFFDNMTKLYDKDGYHMGLNPWAGCLRRDEDEEVKDDNYHDYDIE